MLYLWTTGTLESNKPGLLCQRRERLDLGLLLHIDSLGTTDNEY